MRLADRSSGTLPTLVWSASACHSIDSRASRVSTVQQAAPAQHAPLQGASQLSKNMIKASKIKVALWLKLTGGKHAH